MVGFAALVIGLAIFFNRRLAGAAESCGGLVVWHRFAGVQCNQLGNLRRRAKTAAPASPFRTDSVSRLHGFGANPSANDEPRHTPSLHRPALFALLFGVLNTVVAYGAFGMALEVWEVSRVSSVAASAPLFTVVGSMLGLTRPLPG